MKLSKVLVLSAVVCGLASYPFTQDATGVMTIDQTSKDCYWIASASSQ
ncbi:MAG: hypothetical protein L6Q84_25240 [Polyangiaceae bacterium]|nr:hypothetical protein [Polyangiaceae bacterium]